MKQNAHAVIHADTANKAKTRVANEMFCCRELIQVVEKLNHMETTLSIRALEFSIVRVFYYQSLLSFLSRSLAVKNGPITN